MQRKWSWGWLAAVRRIDHSGWPGVSQRVRRRQIAGQLVVNRVVHDGRLRLRNERLLKVPLKLLLNFFVPGVGHIEDIYKQAILIRVAGREHQKVAALRNVILKLRD